MSSSSFEPKSFSSSRGKRAAVVQSAEDFMDEEDLRTLRERLVIAKEGQGSEEYHTTLTSGAAASVGLQVLRRLGRAGLAATHPKGQTVSPSPASLRNLDCLFGVGYEPPAAMVGLAADNGDEAEVMLEGEERGAARLNDEGAFRGESDFVLSFVKEKRKSGAIEVDGAREGGLEEVLASLPPGSRGRRTASLAYLAARSSHLVAAPYPPPVERQLRTVQDLGSRFAATTTLSSEISEQQQQQQRGANEKPPPSMDPAPPPPNSKEVVPRRSFESWNPAPLLSKRMNLKPITPSSEPVPMASQLHSFVQSLLGKK